MAAEAFAFGPFIDCEGGDCRWVAVAAVLVEGDGYLYGLRREHGHWSVYRWRAHESPARADLVRDGVFGRAYAESCAREDALARRRAP